MSDYIDIKKQDFSFLGTGSKMSGIFHLQGVTHISSSIDGEIFMENQADLCIETNGQFAGNITCHNLEIYGNFKGTIKASGKVTVYPPANLIGVVKAKDLVVYPGATINIDGFTNNSNGTDLSTTQ